MFKHIPICTAESLSLMEVEDPKKFKATIKDLYKTE